MTTRFEIMPVTLEGRWVRLEPLAERHAAELAQVGLDAEIWRYMLYGDIAAPADLLAWVREMLRRQEEGGDLPFAVIERSEGRAIGATRYLNINPEARALEVGGTWYGRAYQGTAVNPESKYLLLRHAFETLGCVRVQLKTDSLNLRSQRAIAKLGATQEGVLRNHMILPDGRLRHSVIYSILPEEWPAVRAGLQARLAAIAAG